jgi:phosphoglycerol transferase MdoB-like AlkP superfamily enzyme
MHGKASAAMQALSLPPRARFWVICLIVNVIIESLDRVGVLAYSVIAREGTTLSLLKTLPLGAIEDAAMAVVLGLPFLAGLYLFAGLFRRRSFAILAHVLLFGMLAGFIFCEVSEVFFWNEFDSRYNSVAVSYLIFPREVIGNIRESYNLALFLPLVGAAAGLVYLAMRRALSRALAAPLPKGERVRVFATAVPACIAGFLYLYYKPADPFESRTANEITKNGIHSLLRAALTNDEQYDGLYVTRPQEERRKLLLDMVAQDNTSFIAPDKPPFILRHVANPPAAKKLNVVLVLNESFGSTYVDDLDNTRNESISPNVTRLAKDGLFYTNVYATGNRTVRALEAVFTSFPPIPGISTARRSGSEGMNSLPFLLEHFGYQTAFLYGGRATFDNMGHFWSTIGFDKVWEQSDIADQGFTTIWGVADEYLYKEALTRLDAMAQGGQPFFLSLLTVSNHRPYTFPDGRLTDRSGKRKRKEDAAAYSDWAFGQFIEQARAHGWFKDTIFVFMGDHGPRVYGAAQVPVQSYRIPLLFYSPANIPAARVATLGSNMDVAPTLLGLLGLSYDSPFFGVDLRRVPEGGGRVVMEHNFSVAYGNGREVAMILPARETRGYAMRPGPYELTPELMPDAQMLDRNVALIQSAHAAFYARDYHQLSQLNLK